MNRGSLPRERCTARVFGMRSPAVELSRLCRCEYPTKLSTTRDDQRGWKRDLVFSPLGRCDIDRSFPCECSGACRE